MPEVSINSERYYFAMHWNVEQFVDGVRYVFCDELENYTFYPYVGKLKNVPGYCENKEAFEDSRIFMTNNYSGKLVKVPCNIVEQQKRIYLTDGNFNKYWKLISKGICCGIHKRTGNNMLTQAAMNEMVDLSLVMNPARTAEIGSSFTIEYKGKENAIEMQRLISRRASALEDNRIRFVYAKNDRFVHDKTCEQAEKIKYWDFNAAEKLPEDRELCPHCKRKIYIRNAIKTDTKRFGWYQHFFEKGGAGNKVIESFLDSGEVKLHMDCIDELQVKYKEDIWLIKMDKQGVCTLWHNNYVMVNDRERYITSGFHEQKHYPPYLSGILTYIASYDWQKHLEVRTAISDTVEEQKNQVEISEESVWKKSLDWFKGMFMRKEM